MPDWLTDIEPHWQWLSLGVLLAAAEIIAPGFFLIWIGVVDSQKGENRFGPNPKGE